MSDEKPTPSRSSDVDNEVCKRLIEEYFNVYGHDVKRLDGYEDLNFHLLPPVFRKNSDSDDDIWPHGCVLKIISSQQSENIAFIEEYINVLLHLGKKEITKSTPIKNKYGNYYAYWTNPSENKNSHEYFTFAAESKEQIYPFCHVEALKRQNFFWNLECVPILRDFLNEINIPENRKSFIERVFDEFESCVLSKLDLFEKGVIHNDLNDRNLLVERLVDENSIKIKFIGVLDFTDMVHTAYIFEIAIAACYLCFNNPDDGVNLIASLIAGYQRRPLIDMEYNLLKICICMRLAQSLVNGLHTHSLDSSNEYLLTSQTLGWELLYMFYDMNNEYFVDRIRQLVDAKQTT